MKNKIAKKILEMEKDKLMSVPESDRDWELITALDLAIKAGKKVRFAHIEKKQNLQTK